MSISSLRSKLYLPPVTEVWGKGNIFTSMCHSFCVEGGLHPGGSASGGLHGGSVSMVRGLHPVGWADPPLHRILQDTVNERVVRILLVCILVCFDVLSKML